MILLNIFLGLFGFLLILGSIFGVASNRWARPLCAVVGVGLLACAFGLI